MKYLERIYPWLLLSPVLLPVVICGGFIYPYLVPKTLLFYAISLITAAVFAVLVAHKHEFFWSRLTKWEAWVPAILLVLAYITSIFGTDFYRSFWSLLVRGDGLLMLSCTIGSFYLILLYADKKFFEWLLRAVAVVGSAVAIYGIGEWLIGGGRIGSLLGNAAFFAGYLGIAFFATIAAVRTLPIIWKRVAIVGAALQVIAIILTATRGTILALVVTAVAYLIYVVFSGEGKQRAWSAGILVALIALGGILFAFRSELAKSSFEPVARVASISFADGDIASRLFIWKNMVVEIKKSPLLGVGSEHIDALFNRFYDPTQIEEQWFDRSHNAFLDYAAQYGVGGLTLYVLLICAVFTSAARSRRRGEKQYAIIFALLAISYAVQNFFVFDTISSFWLLLALLSTFLAMSFGDSTSEALNVSGWTKYASWIFGLVLVCLVIPVTIRPALAAYNLAHAYTYQLTDVQKEVSYLSHGIALGTYADIEYGYEAYDMYANNQAAVLSGESRTNAYQATLSILTQNFNRYPYDARTALYLAHTLSLAPSDVTVDRNLISSALERAIRLSPKRSQPWYILTNISLSEANTYSIGSAERKAGYSAAKDILTRYIALVPTLSQPHFVLAQLLLAAGDPKGATAEAEKGKADYKSDLETARRAVGYYETVLDLKNAEFFLKEILHFDPNNTAAKEDLAKVQAYEQSTK